MGPKTHKPRSDPNFKIENGRNGEEGLNPLRGWKKGEERGRNYIQISQREALCQAYDAPPEPLVGWGGGWGMGRGGYPTPSLLSAFGASISAPVPSHLIFRCAANGFSDN